MAVLTYAQRFCRPELFEPDDDTVKLLARLLLMDDGLREIDVDKREDYALNHVMNVVDDVVGEPEATQEWVGKYFSLWNRLITLEMRGGFSHGKALADTVHRPLTERYLRKLATIHNRKWLTSAAEHLISPWLPSFCYWHAAGRKEYIVSKGLGQKLRQTELRGYPASRLHLPYDAIYIDLQDYGAFGKEGVTMEGCLAYNAEQEILLGVITGEETTVPFPRLISILKTGTIQASLDSSLDMYRGKAHGDAEAYRKPWKALCSYLVNIILYATMPDVESTFQHYDKNYTRLQAKLRTQRSPKKREKIKQRLRTTSAVGYTYLGGSITVDRTQDRVLSEGDGRRKITVRTLVSGHWRDQPCGRQRLDRKRIWIEPFWRGPDAAAITQKIHHLQ